MDEFHTKAHIDEYVIDGGELGTFSAANESLTYTRPEDGSPTRIPLTEIDAIRLERNTTLHHMRFLGISSVILALVLTIVPTGQMYLHGLPTTQTAALLFAFIYLLGIGAWFTAYDYLTVGNHDVIDLYIRTGDGTHVICGSIDDDAFVHACERLIDSDISTTNRNPKLATEVS